MKALLALPVCLALAGCNTAAMRPILDDLDPRIMEACLKPYGVDRPDKMTRAQVARAWGHDRVALIDCARRHGALAKILKARDAALRGQ